MLSETKEGLTKMIKKLAAFAAENGLKINADKTKCMVLTKLADIFVVVYRVGI